MNLLGIGSIVETVGKIADDLITSDQERAQMALEERKLDIEEQRIGQATALAQMEVNKVEAASSHWFTAGWRPGTGWVCLAGLAYTFLAYPLLGWGWRLLQAVGWIPAEFGAPPPLDVEYLMVLLTGLLGLGGYRTVEKVKRAN